MALTSSIFLLPNGTFFVELAVFIALIWLIGKYALPPINKAMEARQEQIRSSLEAADAARADAAAADDERRVALDEAVAALNADADGTATASAGSRP